MTSLSKEVFNIEKIRQQNKAHCLVENFILSFDNRLLYQFDTIVRKTF